MKKNGSLINNNFLNIVPMICSMMVVIIHQHTVAGNALTASSRIISFFTHGISITAVPIFFLLSGYLFFRTAHSFSDVFQKQKKRIVSVLMPFLAWSTLYYVLYAVVSVVFPGFLQSNVDLSPVGILKGIVFFEFAFPLWYMFQLCVYVLLTPLLLLVLKNKIVSLLVLVTSAVLGILACVDFSVDLGGYERALFQVNFFAYYWLGCILARLDNVQAALVKLAKRIPWTILIVALVAAGILESLIFDELIPSFNNRCAVPLVFAAFFLLMVKLCHLEKDFTAPKASTMIIYGIHSAIGIFLGQFVLSKLGLPPIVYFFVSFLAVAFVSVAVARILRHIKPIHWVFSGNR